MRTKTEIGRFNGTGKGMSNVNLVWMSKDFHFVSNGILPEWSKGADLRSARLSSAWVQTPQVPYCSKLHHPKYE